MAALNESGDVEFMIEAAIVEQANDSVAKLKKHGSVVVEMACVDPLATRQMADEIRKVADLVETGVLVADIYRTVEPMPQRFEIRAWEEDDDDD